MKNKTPDKTPQSKRQARAIRRFEMDCERHDIISSGMNGRVERDLYGRLFFVEYGREGGRKIDYGEALAFITEHAFWKQPWKVLAMHGIKPPPTNLRAGQTRHGRRTMTP
jgi:hypothetical protein